MDTQMKKEIAETIKKVVQTFTAQYTKAYLLAIVRKIKLEITKEPDDWHLQSRPKKDEVMKEGWITKESVHIKNWNKRYFVFRSNHSIDYYDSDTIAHQLETTGREGKKRGSINLSGYHVIEDPNQGSLVRIKRLAEKMGMEMSSLPKPKEYPPLTFEVHHARRPCYYLKCENKDEFDQWIAQFKTACWNARAFLWDDWCHQRAFPIALRKTRWELGRWGWRSGQGSEEQLIAELIADELEYEMMGKIYATLTGPWIIKKKMRNMILSTIDGMVTAAVRPAWAGLKKAAEELYPQVEPKIRAATEPIFKAEKEIVGKMKESVMSVLEPLLRQHIAPHMTNIMAIIKAPMRDAFGDAGRLFEEKVSKWVPKDDLQKSFQYLDNFGRSYWELKTALKQTDDMYEPLWILREIFSDIYPWGLIWKAHNYIHKHTDNAIYTWEQEILKANDAERVEEIKRDVIIKYRHDSEIATQKYYASILRKIIMPPFEAAVQPAAKHIIEPLAESIPESIREFIDIKQMFEDLYKAIVMDGIYIVLNSDL